MKPGRAALAILLLLPGLALAQGVATCGAPSASCLANKFLLVAGHNLVLNNPTATTTIRASTATGGMLLNSGVANSGGNAAFSFTTTNTLSGSTLILNIGNGASQIATLDNAGNISTAGGFFAGGTTSTGNPVPSVHRALAAAPQAMEFGGGTTNAGGTLSVNFATAFAVAPTCICSDQNTSPAGCGPFSTPVLDSRTLQIGAARADSIYWFCIGQK